MDPQQILTFLQYTLSPHAEQRLQAEQQLKQLESVNGYSVVLLKVVTSDQVDVSLKQCASIALKALIRAHWSAEINSQYSFEDHNGTLKASPNQFVINDEDKALLRTNLVEAIIHTPPIVRTQISLALQHVVECDFPEKYPEIVPKIVSYLTSQDLKSTIGALEALRRTVKKYEYLQRGKKSKGLNELVNTVFPILIQLYQGASAMNTIESAEMQFLMIRIFWSVFNMGIPQYFYEDKNLMPWMTQFLQLLQKPVPADQQPQDLEERPKSPWWKAKKWAAGVFFRMFQRFSDPKLIENKALDQLFARRFTEIYTPQLIQCFVGLLQQRKTSYVTDRLVISSLNFLDSAVRRKEVYPLMKPNLDSLIRDFVFPIVCFSADDAVLWAEDPQEYLRKELDIIDDINPRSSAINFILDVGSFRSKDHLDPLMQFIAALLVRSQSEQNPYLKDGALVVLGILNAKLTSKKLPYRAQIEPLITTFVIPEFSSPHGFLRAKAAWFAQQFPEFEFSNPEIFTTCLRSTLNLLHDKELPVRVTAALALRYLMQNDLAVEDIRRVFPNVMDIYFSLMNEIDNDELVNCLQVLVDRFADDIAPYAVNMVQRMVEAFKRMWNTEEEDSLIAALAALDAIQAILDAISEKPEIYPLVDVHLIPLLNELLKNENAAEFFEETLRIVSFITCFSPTISDHMWNLFPDICACFNRWGNDFAAELLTPFDNYISRGTEKFLTGNYLPLVLDIYKNVVGDPDSYDDHACEAAKLIEVILLNCRGKVDQFIEPIVEIALKKLNTAQKSSLKVVLLEVVSNALYYNPGLLLRILESRNWTQGVFTTWFGLLHRFNRTHDKKIALLGLTSLLSIPFNQLPPVIIGGMKHLLTTIINLSFQLEKQRKDMAEEEEKMNKELEEEEEGEDEDIDWEDDDDHHFGVEGNLTSLAQEAADARENQNEEELDDEDEPLDDDDDLLEEEENFSSAIDDVDEIVHFVDTMKEIASRDAPSYANLIAHLDASVQKSYGELVVLAEQKRAELEQQKLLDLQQLQQQQQQQQQKM